MPVTRACDLGSCFVVFPLYLDFLNIIFNSWPVVIKSQYGSANLKKSHYLLNFFYVLNIYFFLLAKHHGYAVNLFDIVYLNFFLCLKYICLLAKHHGYGLNPWNTPFCRQYFLPPTWIIFLKLSSVS